VECAISIHNQLEKRIEKIRRVVIHVSETDAKRIIRADQQKYPVTQSDADHHIKYCLSIALQHGALTPLHYKPEFLHAKPTRQIIDCIEVEVLNPEKLRTLGNQSDACLLEVYLENGETITVQRSRAEGSFAGLKTSERVLQLRKVVAKKRKMLEEVCGMDLMPVERLVYDLESHNGSELLDLIQTSMETRNREQG